MKKRCIKVEYKLSTREIQKINEECDLGVNFDETFKTDNHILSIVSRANGMIGRMGRNFISVEANVALKIWLTPPPKKRPHIEYCTQAWAPESRHGSLSVILRLEGIQRRVIKIISKVVSL